MNLPANELTALQTVAAVNPNFVVVLVNGSTVDLRGGVLMNWPSEIAVACKVRVCLRWSWPACQVPRKRCGALYPVGPALRHCRGSASVHYRSANCCTSAATSWAHPQPMVMPDPPWP